MFIDINQPLGEYVNVGVIAFGQFGNGPGLKTTIVVNRRVGISICFCQKLFENIDFPFIGVGPEGVVSGFVVPADQKANQVIKRPVWYAFDIQKKFYWVPFSSGNFCK